MAESKMQFRARVRALTGVAYRAIPLAPADEVISSIILARRGQVYIVAAPSRDGDETSPAAAAALGGGFNLDFSHACAACEESGMVLAGHFECVIRDASEWTPVLRRCVLD